MAILSSATIVLLLLAIKVQCNDSITASSTGPKSTEHTVQRMPPATLASLDTTRPLPSVSEEYIVVPGRIWAHFRSTDTLEHIIDVFKSTWKNALNITDESLQVVFWSQTEMDDSNARCNSTLCYAGSTTDLLYVIVVPRLKFDPRTMFDPETAFTATLRKGHSKIGGILAGYSFQNVFAFTDSVWMRNSPDVATTLSPFWSTTLRQWNASDIRVIPLRAVPGPPDHAISGTSDIIMKVIYLVAGESQITVNIDQARLRIRQVLAEKLVTADIWTTPFQWSPETPKSTVLDDGKRTSPEPQTQNISRVDSVYIEGANFSFNDSVTIVYTTDQQLRQTVELFHELWSFVFGLPLEEVKVQLIHEAPVTPIGSMRDKAVIHEALFEIRLMANVSVSMTVDQARRKFRRLMNLSLSDMNVVLPALTTESSESATGSRWTLVSFPDIHEASGTLTRNVTLAPTYVYLMFDDVSVSNATKNSLPTVTKILLETWTNLLVVDGVSSNISVKLALNSWMENVVSSPTTSMVLSYVVIVLTDNRTYQVDLATKELLHEKIGNQTTAKDISFTFHHTAGDIFATQDADAIDRYAIFDVVNLAYATESVSSSALEAIRVIWSRILGDGAWSVAIDLYRVSAEVSFSLAGDSGLPISKLFFRVAFTSNISDWNITALRVQFREVLPSVRNASLLFSVVPIEQPPAYVENTTPFQTATTISSSYISSSPAPLVSTVVPGDSSSTLSDTIVFCYPNETERNRHLSALRQMWADSLGANVFDVRLTVLQDLLLNTSVENSTQIVHQVSYVVVPSTSHQMDIPAAKIIFETLKRNSSDFNQNDCDSSSYDALSVSASLGSPTTADWLPKQQTWNLTTANGTATLCSYLFYDTVWANPNHTTLALNNRNNTGWRSYAAVRLTLLPAKQELNQTGGELVEVPYAVLIISSNCSLPMQTLRHDVEADVNSERTYTEVAAGSLTNNTVNSSIIPSDVVVYVILDSVYITRLGAGNWTEVLKGLRAAWQYAVAWKNGSVDVKVDFAGPTSLHDSVFCVIRILTTNLTLNVQAIRQKFKREIHRHSSVYGLYIANMEEDTTTTLTTTLATTAVPATTQPSSKITNSEITDTIPLQYYSSSERDLDLEEIRKLWALALGSPLSSVTITYKSETPIVSTPPGSSVYQLTYTITDAGSTGKDPTTAKRTFDKYLNSMYGTFVPSGDDGATGTSTTVTRENDTTTVAMVLANNTVMVGSGNSTLSPSSKVLNMLQTAHVYPYVLYDEFRLLYANATDRDEALLTLESIWGDSIGQIQAGLVRLVVYQESPPYLNDSVSGGKTHTFFYVVAIASDLSNLDLSSAKDNFRKRVLANNVPYIVNFAQVYPSTRPNPVKTFLLVDDGFSGGSNNTSATDLGNSLATLYRSALASDLQQIQVWNYTSTSSSDDTSVVLVVTNNTALTQEKVQAKFKDTLLRISLAAMQKSLSSDLDNRTEVTDDTVKVTFRQSTRLNLGPSDNQDTVVEDLRHAWEDALKPLVTNITLSKSSSRSQMPVAQLDGQVLNYMVEGALAGNVLNLTVARQTFAKLSDKVSGVHRVTTPSPITANVLFP